MTGIPIYKSQPIESCMNWEQRAIQMTNDIEADDNSSKITDDNSSDDPDESEIEEADDDSSPPIVSHVHTCHVSNKLQNAT